MKAKRLLFLVMAICLASGVKAQFNDSEVYYYINRNGFDYVIRAVKFHGNYLNSSSNSAGAYATYPNIYSKLDAGPNKYYTYYFNQERTTSEIVTYYSVELGYSCFSKDRIYLDYYSPSGIKTEYVRIKYNKNSPNGIEHIYGILNNNNSGNSGGSAFSGGYSGGYNGNNYGGSSSSSSSSSSSIPRTRCPNCTNGRRVYESTVGYSGTQIRYSTCSECGKRYMSSHTTHRHDRCTTCHGTGYLD